MPTHNLHSRMNNFFQRREEHRLNREQCGNRPAANTLQSVLRGDIPSEYLHLTSFPGEQRRTCTTSQSTASDTNTSSQVIMNNNNNRQHHHQQNNHQQQQQQQHLSSAYINNTPENNAMFQIPLSRNMEAELRDTSSPSRLGSGPNTIHRMSPYGRPTPGVPGFGYRTHQDEYTSTSEHYYDRRSPSYHNSRSSPYYDPGSPYNRRGGGSPGGHSHHRASPMRPYSPHTSTSSHSPSLAPNSPCSAQYSPHHSSEEVFTSNEQPIDLSCKSEKSPTSPPELVLDDTQENQSNGSMLRNLLSSGKQNQSAHSDRDSPCSDVLKPEVPVTGSTPVTLAKKMIHPITSRVSDWLVKIVQFSKSIPEFSNMSSNDKLTLLSNSWARILILFMAENEFEFAVTPLQTPEGRQNAEGTNMDELPTMKAVETVQSFIRKCKNMNLDQKEYALLRMSVLFNTGHVGLDNPEMVEKLNAAVQQLLQQHVTTTKPDDAMHYSRILMCLPTLYGINCKMIENLFCQGIHPNIDIDVLLIEMLRNL